MTRNLGFNESVIGFDYKASPGYVAHVTVYGSEPFAGKIYNEIDLVKYDNKKGSKVETRHYSLSSGQIDNGWKITRIKLEQIKSV
ncbi:hypothetical protein ACT3SZ_10015 [Corynebacterium sp. AOP40-9SA-29]|uniref:hypothetical protein n=1 Tax=Corynebacterium sp. AOP40-9SA-29 TaxID=3457677 RepID=UPI004034D87B